MWSPKNEGVEELKSLFNNSNTSNNEIQKLIFDVSFFFKPSS